MLYHLFQGLSENISAFNVFSYLTTRSGAALITALIISFLISPRMIRWFKTIQAEGQPIRDCGPETHLLKKGTPTMGGLMILISITISTLLWADLSNKFVWIVLGSTLLFGLLGFIDDYAKLKKNSSAGISSRKKFLGQLFIALIGAYLIYNISDAGGRVYIPYTKSFYIDLGLFYLVFASFVIVGSSNAVNFTDGLDGLAIVPIMISASCFALICYLVGNANFADYLKINFIQGTGELAILCAAVGGAGLGFLWYNAPPAHVFMGDTGSLSLGAMLGSMSVVTRHEFVWAIIGGLFVIETISVILQIGYFRLTGKRIFLMAPIHHHFEKKGWNEPTVVIRFWIIAILFAIIGLSSLKLR